METKVCSKCNEEKELTYFRKRNDRPLNPYRSMCKKCESIREKKYRIDNKIKIDNYNLWYRQNNKEFVYYIQKKWRENNKEYFKEYNLRAKEKDRKRRWRENNREYSKLYNIENKQKINENSRKWYINNKFITKQRSKNYLYNKLKTDDLFKLKHSIRGTIRRSIESRGYKKNSKSHIILGCSFEEFKVYIENKFYNGMCWENCGLWHLDHKIPISWANTTDDVYMLNHYTNFQPLWAYDNLSKGNRYSS